MAGAEPGSTASAWPPGRPVDGTPSTATFFNAPASYPPGGLTLRTLLAGTVVVALVAAGCLAVLPDEGDEVGAQEALDDDAASLDCLTLPNGTERCNIESTRSPPTREANELSIAVNPTDPDNVVISGKDYTPEAAGDCTWDGIYVTHDGGETWSNGNIPGSPWKNSRNPSEANVTPFSKYWCATDPVLAFGPEGTLYWTVMPYQCDPASGSKLGRGVLPMGGLNDWAFTCSSMYVLASHDGGRSWDTISRVATGPLLMHDKQWIAAAPDGETVLLCWDWNVAYVAARDMVCSVSHDQAESWSPYERVAADWETWDDEALLPWIEFGPDGRAYMVFTTGITDERGRIGVTWSDDGLDWHEPAEVASYRNPPERGAYGWPALDGSDFRIFAVPSLAVDRSEGPHGGNLYLAWMDYIPETDEADVLLSTSTDGGGTWSEPLRVNDDDEGNGKDQFMPSVDVGPDGVVDLSWYDRRDDPDNHVFHLYYAYSADGGESVSENLRVTDVPSQEKHSRHQNGMIFLGDYRDTASSEGAAHLTWVDTRHEKADAFYAEVDRPSTVEGSP